MCPKLGSSSFSSGRTVELCVSFTALCMQPEPLRRGEMQVLGHALAVGEVRDRQSRANRERQHTAERRGLVELRDDQRLGARGLEHLERLGEAAAVGAGGQREHGAHAMAFARAASSN